MKRLITLLTAVSVLSSSAVGLSALADSGKDTGNSNTPVTATATTTATSTATATVVPTTGVTPTPTATATVTPMPTATPTPTVTPTPTPVVTDVSGVKLNKTSLDLKVGDTFTLTPILEPAGATAYEIQWTSSSECVNVKEGVITAISSGPAVVNVIVWDKEKKNNYIASCYINVKDESGVLNLSVTEGVKQVLVTKDGKTTEVTAGANKLETGTYTVQAESLNDYKLSEYSGTVTVEEGKQIDLSISASKVKCTVTIPEVVGCTVTPVNNSVSPVDLNGSYSFTVSLGDSYESENMVVKANGEEIVAVDGVYTIKDIKTDIVVTIDGVETKSWDTSLKSLTVLGVNAVLTGESVYEVTVPYNSNVTTSDISVTPNDENATHTVTNIDGVFYVEVKAEDGTSKKYSIVITKAEKSEFDDIKEKISNIKFDDVIQSSDGYYASQNTVKEKIGEKITDELKDYEEYSVSIENGDAKEPIAGKLSKPDGENGYYEFNVTVSKDGSEETAEDPIEEKIKIKINIVAYSYVMASGDISATATTVTVKNVSSRAEVALYNEYGSRVRTWTEPDDGTVTFKNLVSSTVYVVKVREIGSNLTPANGTVVTTKGSVNVGGAIKYYTITFDEGSHGEIVSGKNKQSVRYGTTPDAPKVEADKGYVFVGWSSNGRLIEDPEEIAAHSDRAYTAMYEKSSNVSDDDDGDDNDTKPEIPNISFIDVKQGSWYYQSVMNVCKKGYMNGTVQNYFEPDLHLTRAMLVTILYRYANEPKVYEDLPFRDVPNNTWYTNAVRWAAEAGIVEGTNPGEFEPELNITREQLATIMYRYAEVFGYDISASGDIVKYSDVKEISEWAQKALIWTVGAGIIDGKDNNMIDPKGNATRAEAATIIERFDTIIN